jgi:hypothetical protein
MVEKNNQGFIIYKTKTSSNKTSSNKTSSKYTRKIIGNPDNDMENIKQLNPDAEKVMVCKANALGSYECKYKKFTKKTDKPDDEEKKGGKSRKRNLKRKKTLKKFM